MDGQNLWAEIQSKRKELGSEIDSLRQAGFQLARNENAYRLELAKFIASARASGIPVTIIDNLAKGEETIANLRMQRDMSEVLYKTAQEKINTIKLELRIIQSQYEREWSRPEGV